MADLNDIQAAETVKIVGASAAGTEQTPIQSTAQGALHLNLRDASGNELLAQKTMAASVPVTLAVDQSSLSIKPDPVLQSPFGRLRTTDVTVLLDGALNFSSKPFIFTQSLNSGTVTYQSNRASYYLQVGTTSGHFAIQQTKEYVPYTPGQGSVAYLTGILNSAKVGLTQRVGLFDDNNGLFFQLAGTSLGVVVRTNTSGSPVDTVIPQASWNIDPLDGTGPSGVTIDITKAQIFVFDYQWLGLGRVRFGISVDGGIVYCHETYAANIATVVYMRTGSLPVRYEIRNTATTASSSTLEQVCFSVQTEGKSQLSTVLRGVNTLAVKSIVDSAFSPIISLRLKTAFNRTQIIPVNFSCGVTTTDNLYVVLIKNATTLTGASWVSVATDSNAEYDISSTALTGGEIVYSTTVQANTTAQGLGVDNFLLKILSDYAGTSDTLTLAARSVTTAASAFGALTFKEIL